MSSRRRRRDPVPPSPRRYTVAVDGRPVAELSIETGGDIVPGSVVVLADVSKIRGPARELHPGRCSAAWGGQYPPQPSPWIELNSSSVARGCSTLLPDRSANSASRREILL